MSKVPLRIGIWFDPIHVAYGGPALVLIGTILGFLQGVDPPILLMNSPGDLNWLIDRPVSWTEFDIATRGLKRALGPLLFSAADVHIQDPNTSPVWRLGSQQLTLYLAPSSWFGSWVSRGMPFYDLSHRRPMMIWGAGVDTSFFRPSLTPKVHSRVVPGDFCCQEQSLDYSPALKHDINYSSPTALTVGDSHNLLSFSRLTHSFFIYFKSQRWTDLGLVHQYLFQNYFRMHGPTLVYYFYSPEELLAAATGAEFCIYIGCVETQGLAALEIMACGCPLFVLDVSLFSHEGITTQQATSVCCWDAQCGMKSSLASMSQDFPQFLKELPKYTPRKFVEAEYSFAAAAGKLRRALESLP